MKRLVVGLFAVLSLGVLGFAAAAQASEYLCNEKAESCTVLGTNLTVFVLEDMSLPAAVECPVEDIKSEGTAKGLTGETTSAVFEKASELCKPTAKALNLKEEEAANACGKVVRVEAIDLPWTTPISEGKSNDWWVLIASGGKGEPGYAITCETAGISLTDECKSPAGHDLLVLVENLAKEGSEPKLLDVLFSATLLEKAEAATCSLSGTEAGLVVGEILLSGWNGSSAIPLEVSGEGE